MTGPRVLIAGASIAGPALAHWLSRSGAEVTVVERAPELRPGGQAVDARGVAKEVIVRMGIDAQVRAACTDTAGAYTVDENGTVLETFRADDDGGDGFIAEIEILRGDLSQVLYDHTRDRVENEKIAIPSCASRMGRSPADRPGTSQLISQRSRPNSLGTV